MALFDSCDLKAWSAARSRYDTAMSVVAAKKQHQLELLALDAWFNTCRPADPATYVLDPLALSKIVQWKLSRGTFRPGLLQKAQSNSAAVVKDAYVRARDLLLAAQAAEGPDGLKSPVAPATLEAAVKAMRALDQALHGVGPATASALLCRQFPGLVAFMSDEAMLESGLFARTSEIKYDMKTFGRFNELVQGKARALNALAGRATWTGDDIGRALWARRVLEGAGPTPAASAKSAPPRKAPAAAPGAAIKVKKAITKR